MGEKKNQVNYLSLVVLGVSLITVGILLTFAINPAFISFMGSGLVFIVIGLSKRAEHSIKKKNNSDV